VIEAITDRVKLGAYGSIRYEASNIDEAHSTFTYRRFVLTTDANIAPRLHGYMELELERFRKLELEKGNERADGGLTVKQSVEGTDDSEISLEQAWLQFDLAKWLAFRGGAVLVPVGRFNLRHDDNLWDLPRRSLVDRGTPVLPCRRRGTSSARGSSATSPSVAPPTWTTSSTSCRRGLDFNFEQVAMTRSPEAAKQVIEVELEPTTGTFNTDSKEGKAVHRPPRLQPRPRARDRQLVLLGPVHARLPRQRRTCTRSASTAGPASGPSSSKANGCTRTSTASADVARQLARVARDSESEFENPDLETEVEFELAGLATNKHGYWIDLRYRFWPEFLTNSVLGHRFENPQLIAVLRGEQVWLDDLIEEAVFGGGTLTDFETEDRRVDRITVGLAYRPVPSWSSSSPTSSRRRTPARASRA
jgi:hypothetical protein